MNLNVPTLAFATIVATLPLSIASAQAPQPGAAADTATVVSPRQPNEPAMAREPRAVGQKGDARLCLEFPTDLMVIKCAEKYRLDKRAP